MKLIDREPTEEMLFAARFYKEGTHTLACAWRAMYDAAPEVQQEPIAFEYHGRFSFAHIHQDERFLYAFPPDAQAEIKKQSARIKELEMAIDNEMVMAHIGVFNSGDDPKAALNKLQCFSEGVGGFFAHYQLQEQAAEISRLKAVIEKCHSALTQCKEWQEDANTLTCHNHEAVELALAAIMEEGL